MANSTHHKTDNNTQTWGVLGSYVYLYENQQLNKGKGAKKAPEGAYKDSDRNALLVPANDSRNLGTTPKKKDDQTGKKRNFWKGSQKGNLKVDKSADALILAVGNASDTKFGTSDSDTKIKDVNWASYQASVEDEIVAALGTEFDPPPFASKSVIQSAAEEWARMTNEWLENDQVAKSYYDILRKFTWNDAVKFGANKKIYKKAK